MTVHYLYGTVLTGEAVAANNRGDNIGNTTTLQKVFHHDDLHTSVSAEAIRFALRYYFQLESPETVNRKFEHGKLEYFDKDRTYWNPATGAVRIDDDLMGFMDAKASAAEKEEVVEEASDEQPKKGKGKSKAKGTVTIRQSPLAVGRAVSLRPYRGELSFNCVSGTKEAGQLSLYAAEMHTTEYQYSFGLNLSDVINKAHIGQLMSAVADLPPVAGNHARFAYDFSPASIVLRVTSTHSSKIQNCFEHDEDHRTYTIAKLIHRVEAGDIPASELIVGGEVTTTEEGEALKALKVAVFKGVTAAVNAARQRIAQLDSVYAAVAPQGVAGGA
jgi:CRISPR-associated protein Cst2